jgi:hypothetical protein
VGRSLLRSAIIVGKDVVESFNDCGGVESAVEKKVVGFLFFSGCQQVGKLGLL